MRTKKEKKKELVIENKIQFRQTTEGEIDEEAECNEANEEFWCLPFSVDDLEDFQTEFKKEGMNNGIVQISSETEQKLDSDKQWFEPQDYNQWNYYTRVIVTMCPTDNNATILIILDEP